MDELTLLVAGLEVMLRGILKALRLSFVADQSCRSLGEPRSAGLYGANRFSISPLQRIPCS